MMHEDLTAMVGEVFHVKGFAELRWYLSFWDGTWKQHRTVNRFKLLWVRNGWYKITTTTLEVWQRAKRYLLPNHGA